MWPSLNGTKSNLDSLIKSSDTCLVMEESRFQVLGQNPEWDGFLFLNTLLQMLNQQKILFMR